MFCDIVRKTLFPELDNDKLLMVFLEGFLKVKRVFVVVFEEGEDLLVVLESAKHVVLVYFCEVEYFGLPYLLGFGVLDVICA